MSELLRHMEPSSYAWEIGSAVAAVALCPRRRFSCRRLAVHVARETASHWPDASCRWSLGVLLAALLSMKPADAHMPFGGVMTFAAAVTCPRGACLVHQPASPSLVLRGSPACGCHRNRRKSPSCWRGGTLTSDLIVLVPVGEHDHPAQLYERLSSRHGGAFERMCGWRHVGQNRSRAFRSVFRSRHDRAPMFKAPSTPPSAVALIFEVACFLLDRSDGAAAGCRGASPFTVG